MRPRDPRYQFYIRTCANMTWWYSGSAGVGLVTCMATATLPVVVAFIKTKSSTGDSGCPPCTHDCPPCVQTECKSWISDLLSTVDNHGNAVASMVFVAYTLLERSEPRWLVRILRGASLALGVMLIVCCKNAGELVRGVAEMLQVPAAALATAVAVVIILPPVCSATLTLTSILQNMRCGAQRLHGVGKTLLAEIDGGHTPCEPVTAPVLAKSVDKPAATPDDEGPVCKGVYKTGPKSGQQCECRKLTINGYCAKHKSQAI